MLEYRVLGGFGLAHRGADRDAGLSVGGPRRRRLVAMLLIHRNAVVSVDRLAEVVFAPGRRCRGRPQAGAPRDLTVAEWDEHLGRLAPYRESYPDVARVGPA